jgi:hypothetical protein
VNGCHSGVIEMSEDEKGCSECFDYWSAAPGRRPREVSDNVEAQVLLQVCPRCGAFWEASERFARILSEDEATKVFPNYFALRGNRE